MIKKIYWQPPLVTLGSLALGAAFGCATYYARESKAVKYHDFYRQPVVDGTNGIMQAYMAAIENGAKLLTLPGYTHTPPLTAFLDVSKQENLPLYRDANKAGYILLDDLYGLPKLNADGTLNTKEIQPLYSSQVACAMFRTDLGSFITGIAVGEFLNEHQAYFAPQPNDQLTWATYGGDTFSSVTGYMGGLQRGIHYFNQNIVPKKVGYKPIKQVFLGASENANFAKSFAATGGNALINQFLAHNVNVLVPVAGNQTQQAVRMIEQYRKHTVVIGVDSPGENDTNTNLPLPDGQNIGNGKIIQFSSIKNLDKIGAAIMDNINHGITPQEVKNNLGGFGYISVGTPTNGGVGTSLNGQQYVVNAVDILKPAAKIATYEQASQVLMRIAQQLGLNEDQNKCYVIPHASVELQASCFYTNLVNQGYAMFPLEANQLDAWIASKPNGVDYTKAKSQLLLWLKTHQTEIQDRKDFSLEHQLDPVNFYPGITQLIINSPSVPLLDKSFTQTSYMGLVYYWRQYNIFLPAPDTK